MSKYTLTAEFEENMTVNYGKFDSMEAASKKIDELENVDGEYNGCLEGAEMILTDDAGRQWMFTDQWEEVNGASW